MQQAVRSDDVCSLGGGVHSRKGLQVDWFPHDFGTGKVLQKKMNEKNFIPLFRYYWTTFKCNKIKNWAASKNAYVIGNFNVEMV